MQSGRSRTNKEATTMANLKCCLVGLWLAISGCAMEVENEDHLDEEGDIEDLEGPGSRCDPVTGVNGTPLVRNGWFQAIYVEKTDGSRGAYTPHARLYFKDWEDNTNSVVMIFRTLTGYGGMVEGVHRY